MTPNPPGHGSKGEAERRAGLLRAALDGCAPALAELRETYGILYWVHAHSIILDYPHKALQP